MFSPEDIRVANATFRKSGTGAVGSKAVVPLHAKEWLDANLKKGDPVLDFGAGKIDNLKDYNGASIALDYDVTLYDFGDNKGAAINQNALENQYELVMASNVMNVQNSKKMLSSTVKQLASASKNAAIANLPTSPRKGAFKNLTGKQGADLLEKELRTNFISVERIAGTPSNPVFLAKGPKKATLKQLEAKAIKQGRVRRSTKYGVGKQVGKHIYMEKSFASKLPKKAQLIIKKFEKEHPDFDYKVVKFNEKTGDTSFIQSRNFDESTEPSIDASIKYTVGEGFSNPRRGSTVYHHKWSMVDDSYKGFSTKESMERTLQWCAYVDRKGISRSSIGSKKNWENISKLIN